MSLLAIESLQNPIWFVISLACLVKGSYLCKIIHAHGKMSLNESFNIINFSLIIKIMLITENLEDKIYLKEKTHIFIQHRNDNILVQFLSKIHLYVYVHHIHTPIHYNYNHAIYNAICVSQLYFIQFYVEYLPPSLECETMIFNVAKYPILMFFYYLTVSNN